MLRGVAFPYKAMSNFKTNETQYNLIIDDFLFVLVVKFKDWTQPIQERRIFRQNVSEKLFPFAAADSSVMKLPEEKRNFDEDFR